MEKVLVLGATGLTGKIITNLLSKSKSYQPVVMIRKENQAQLFDSNVECVHGDLEKDFSHAFQNIDKCIFAAGSGSSTGDDKTIAVDQDGAIKAIDYAQKNGLEKFVMLSAMGTDTPNAVEGLETYLKAKKKADDYLRASKLNFSIVQPGGLTKENGTQKVNIAEKIGDFGQIAREDVAKAIIIALEKSVANKKSFEMIEGNNDLETELKNY
ncbi:MAG: SDR family oxidoreductase [Bacteroidota bacterium]